LFLKEIHHEIIQLCNDLEFPLIVANSKKSYIELLNPILFRLRERGDNQEYKSLINMQDRFIRYITTEGDLDYIYRTMSLEFDKKVYFLDETDCIVYPKSQPNENIVTIINDNYSQIIKESQILQKEYMIVSKNDTRVLIYPLNMNGVLYGSIIVVYSTIDNLTEYL